MTKSAVLTYWQTRLAQNKEFDAQSLQRLCEKLPQKIERRVQKETRKLKQTLFPDFLPGEKDQIIERVNGGVSQFHQHLQDFEQLHLRFYHKLGDLLQDGIDYPGFDFLHRWGLGIEYYVEYARKVERDKHA